MKFQIKRSHGKKENGFLKQKYHQKGNQKTLPEVKFYPILDFIFCVLGVDLDLSVFLRQMAKPGMIRNQSLLEKRLFGKRGSNYRNLQPTKVDQKKKTLLNIQK